MKMSTRTYVALAVVAVTLTVLIVVRQYRECRTEFSRTYCTLTHVLK